MDVTPNPTGPPHRDLPEQPSLTPDEWQRIARFLFDVLDDIDTASDIARGDDVGYRNIVERWQRRRFEVATTDGYGVVFTCPPLKKGGESEE